MADEAARSSRLGRGLAALIGDMGSETATIERGRGQRRVPIEFLRPNPNNPRRAFGETEQEELAASIRERGIVQPIVVRAERGSADIFEIVAGERRWRAAQRAGLHEVPIVVIEASDAEALEFAIIENVQRADLNAIEEADGYQMLIDRFGHTQEALAKIVGKSRSHLANTLRLGKLSDVIKAHVVAGRLSAGHARMLIGQPNADELASEIVARGLNVRQVEKLARADGARQKRAVKRAARGAVKDADTLALERRVSDALGLQVSVDHRGEGGVLHVRYRDLDQLDEVLRRLERP
ncbi:MAG: ParB/RepB/Spo0J family partition protein [Proteobacteria bacterium]|nr:ParB/RepB/Spo0J family partition protein [Pseudomonadota bacterium]